MRLEFLMIKRLKNTARSLLRWVLRGLYRGRLTKKPLVGTSFEIYYPSDQHLSFFGAKKAHYETHIQDYLRTHKLIKEGDLVFDIGANIGQYMLFFAEMVGKQGHIICFEPNPSSFRVLNINREMNRIANSTLVNKAVGNITSGAYLLDDDITGGRLSTMVVEPSKESLMAGKLVSSEIMSFNDALQVYGCPDFIKIDIEGGEAEIFDDFSSRKFDDKTRFIVEVREETKLKVFDFFKDYTSFCIELGCYIRTPDQIPEFANLIFSKRT